ncbi:MAG TPA: ATP synthase F0 subunit B [Terriglobales bacterium]|nr:ATP synthase F0 subunit B [Terriglobales bacterium]
MTLPGKIGAATSALVRTGVLMLFALSSAGLVSLSAQAQTQSGAAPKPELTNEHAHHSGGPGRQLARSSNEGAGVEKDEFAEFKQSPSVLFISRLTGLNPQRSYWLSLVSNFVVIAIVTFWASRKYLPGIFRDRTAAIQKAMQEAQKASEEARRKLADIEARLMKLDVEIGIMRDAAAKEGAAEEARIEAAAKDDARKIVASAEQEIAAAVKAARRQLTAHAADLAVALAQKQIRVDAATDQALVRNFAGQLGTADASGGRKDGN